MYRNSDDDVIDVTEDRKKELNVTSGNHPDDSADDVANYSYNFSNDSVDDVISHRNTECSEGALPPPINTSNIVLLPINLTMVKDQAL